VPRGQRAFLAVCAALIAFALAYVVVDYARVPRLIYDPLAGGAKVGRGGGALPIGYYGQWLWALAAAGLCGPLAWLATGWRRAAASARALGLAAAWAGTAWLLSVAYFAWMNAP
jgi:hypothetical protein